MTQPSNSAKEEMSSRQILRQKLLALRRETPLELRQTWDKTIGEQLSALFKLAPPTCLAIYSPIRAEPNLTYYFHQFYDMGIQLSLPYVVAKNQPLVFIPWQPDTPMEIDSFGIPIPRNRQIQCQPDCMLIPCVGFNAQNYRLGYGGGFYDRTLAVNRNCRTLGIAYRQTQTDFIASDLDIPLTQIVTELAL